ncbi:MAG: histidine kinase [Gemmatimonadota bacterium]
MRDTVDMARALESDFETIPVEPTVPVERPSSAAPMRPRRRGRTALVVMAVATGFVLLETLKALVGTRLRGLDVGWATLLLQNLPWWYTWAALTPIVFYLGRQFPLTEPRAALRRLPVHALAATLLGSAHIWITGPIFYYANRRFLTAPTLPRLLWEWHATFLMLDIVTYAMILGTFHWVEFYLRHHEGLVVATRLSAQAAQLQRGLAQARLDALQRELHPHFLFNALNGATGLIRKGETGAAVGMLVALGDLLRTTLDRSLPLEIPLGREVALLERYVSIETTRFADRLTISIEIPEAFRSIPVPPLVLQPLVENAVRYGVARRPGPAAVTITAGMDQDGLQLTIADDGPGFPSTILAERRFGVGLSNTTARLEQLYGVRGSLTVRNGPRGGAIVIVTIPNRPTAGVGA